MRPHRRQTGQQRTLLARHEGRRDTTAGGGRVEGAYLQIDVGHQGLAAHEAVDRVEASIRRVRGSPDLRVVKIVHGRGRGSSGGAIRREVRASLRGMAGLRAVIPGERYEIFEERTRQMRSEVGQKQDPDLGRANDGVTLVWVH